MDCGFRNPCYRLGMANTEAATAAASRKAQEGRADWLRARGWVCLDPDALDQLVARVDELERDLRDVAKEVTALQGDPAPPATTTPAPARVEF